MHGRCSWSFIESYYQSSLYYDCALKRIVLRIVFRIGLEVVLTSIADVNIAIVFMLPND